VMIAISAKQGRLFFLCRRLGLLAEAGGAERFHVKTA